MATLKPSAFDDTANKELDNFQEFLLKNNFYKNLQNNLQFNFSTLEHLMEPSNQLNWPANLRNEDKLKDKLNDKLNDKLTDKLNDKLTDKLTRQSKQNRKSSRGSEEDPEKSGLSDFEVIDEEMTNEQSAFLNSVSSISNQLTNQLNNQLNNQISNQLNNQISDQFKNQISDQLNNQISNQFNLNQNLNDDNSTIESNQEDSRTGDDDDEFSLNKLTRAGRRKSSSRLARQTGNGPAKKFSCHLCSFVTENKPEYNAHMDKHYEHRCIRCGYGCRTKGRLNRHIRESHPDLANELGCGDSKRKKRNFNNLKNGNFSKISHQKTNKEDVLNSTMELSNAGSDSTIIIEQQNKFINDSLDQLNNNQKLNSSIQSTIDNSDQPSPSSIADDISEHSQLSRSSSSFEQQVNPSTNQSTLLRYRKYTCKQCTHISMSKKESWEHGKVHIKQDKLLSCPHKDCGFSTGYKHHLEYHLRKHFKSKPYKCIKCNYTCINKSMLASHLKSHSNVYQFRCNDCAYATKYCHSLKLHLRKYNHKPDRVLNLDGSENPYPIIDVYGTRRGPRPKKGVGSLKLIKQVLEDNNHVVVDPNKVEEIVNTLTEQNPEDGDEKLFRLMRSNEEKEVRVDLQLNYIISEQLKANATTQIEDGQTITSSIKSLLNQQQQQQLNQQQQQLNQQLNQQQQSVNKNQQLSTSNSNKLLSKPFNNQTVQFMKEKAACSSSVLSKLSNYCKSPKKQEYQSKPNENTGEQDSEKDKSQLSKSILNNLLTGEHGFALARSLLNPALFNSSNALLNNPANLANEKETHLDYSNQLDNYSNHLLTNQLLHNHLIAQLKTEQQQTKEVNNEANNFLAQLAFNLALNGQTNSNLLNLNSSQELGEQLTNHLINQSLLNPALFNLPNLLNQTILNQQTLLNSSTRLLAKNSSPELNSPVNSENMSAKSLTNSTMITNWQSYLTSLLLNKSTNLQPKINSLLPSLDAQLIGSTKNSFSQSVVSKHTPLASNQIDKKHLEEMVNQKIEEKLNAKMDTHLDSKQNSTAATILQKPPHQTQISSPDLNLVLSSIGQVFNKSTLPTSNLPSSTQNLPTLPNQPSEFDLSTILGYSMLMRMQQQFTNANTIEHQKKLKENS